MLKMMLTIYDAVVLAMLMTMHMRHLHQFSKTRQPRTMRTMSINPTVHNTAITLTQLVATCCMHLAEALRLRTLAIRSAVTAARADLETEINIRLADISECIRTNILPRLQAVNQEAHTRHPYISARQAAEAQF